MSNVMYKTEEVTGVKYYSTDGGNTWVDVDFMGHDDPDPSDYMYDGTLGFDDPCHYI